MSLSQPLLDGVSDLKLKFFPKKFFFKFHHYQTAFLICLVSSLSDRRKTNIAFIMLVNLLSCYQCHCKLNW